MSDPVNDGRDALNHWFGYPWYDAKSDGVRRVEVREPWTTNAPVDILLQWAAWFALALLLAGALYLLIRAFARRERKVARENGEAVGGADRIESPLLSAEDWRRDLLAEARRCRDRGDYTRAIVFLFGHQ